jgi:hypothetical protein
VALSRPAEVLASQSKEKLPQARSAKGIRPISHFPHLEKVHVRPYHLPAKAVGNDSLETSIGSGIRRNPING